VLGGRRRQTIAKHQLHATEVLDSLHLLLPVRMMVDQATAAVVSTSLLGWDCSPAAASIVSGRLAATAIWLMEVDAGDVIDDEQPHLLSNS